MWSKFIDTKLLIFVPFGYALHTRIRGLRNLTNNAATAWIPALILIALASPDQPWSALWKLPVSYICFIAFYELGYLYNDTLGTRGETNPRLRLKHHLSQAEATAVVGIRICVIAIICGLMGWYQQLSWLTFYATLGAVIVLHNTISETAIRLVTFFQMSLMRFIAPIFVWLPREKFLMCLMAGVVFFTFTRFITYLEAKGRLQLPERKRWWYFVSVHLAFCPLSVLISLVLADWSFFLLTIYFIMLFGTYAAMNFKSDTSQPQLDLTVAAPSTTDAPLD